MQTFNRHGIIVLDSPQQIQRLDKLRREARSMRYREEGQRMQLRVAGNKRREKANEHAEEGR